MGTPRIDNIETFANKTLADHGSNLIINGNFDYWQRGTTFTGVGYGADRFQNLNNFVGGGFSVDQLTDVPNINSRHSIRVIKTVSGTTSFSELGFRQWMEKQVFRRIVGKKATVGFWVKSNLSLLSGRLSSNAGFSNNDFNFNINISQANVWEYKTFLIDLSLITETIGIAENQHGGFLDISFGQTALGFGQTSVALNDYFQISQVQVLEGDIKLDGSSFNYSTRNSLEELSLCQRYFEKSFSLDQIPTAGVAAGRIKFRNLSAALTDIGVDLLFTVPKRIIPLSVQYQAAGGLYNITFDNFSERGGQMFMTMASGSTSYNHWTADAEL